MHKQQPYTKKEGNGIVPQPVKFGWELSNAFRGVLSRTNRRRYMKLSRLGRLMNTDLPMCMLQPDM